MTSSTASSADDPRQVLADVQRLARTTRIAQRGTWFPLLVLAAVNLAAVPAYRFGPHHVGSCRSTDTGTRVCAGYIPAVHVFWPVALVLAYAVIAYFYAARARSRGVGQRIRPYVAGGVALAAVLAGASLWRVLQPVTVATTSTAAIAHPHAGALDFVTPAVAIGLGLLILAWVEASRPLAAFAVLYLVVVLVQAGRVIHSTSPWYFLPQLLLPAALLLAASAGFAAVRPRASAPRA